MTGAIPVGTQMVQQLSLFGTLDDSDIKYALDVFRSYSGMSPREFVEHILIWEPKYPFKPKLGPGQINQLEQYRIFAVSYPENMEIWSPDSPKRDKSLWTLEVREVPEPARSLKTISQAILTSTIYEGSLEGSLNALGYTYISQQWCKGFEFVIGNIVLRLFHVYELKDRSLSLIDSSKQWVAKAQIDVKEVTDLKAIETAIAELESLQQELRSVIALNMVSRGSLDTRVRKQ